MPLPQPSLKGRALRLLSAREYSRAELERKLKGHEQTPGLLASVLDELQAKGLVNEQRVIESVLHRHAAKLGAARIKQELQNKGLDPAVVKDAIAGLQTSELERARAIWRKKFGASLAAATSPHDTNAAQYTKQIRFLASRGFGADTIRRVVAGASDESGADA